MWPVYISKHAHTQINKDIIFFKYPVADVKSVEGDVIYAGERG